MTRYGILFVAFSVLTTPFASAQSPKQPTATSSESVSKAAIGSQVEIARELARGFQSEASRSQQGAPAISLPTVPAPPSLAELETIQRGALPGSVK